MATPFPIIVLARHGATEWSALGRHTGRTDIPLTADGERDGRLLAKRLAGFSFGQVLTSPLARARTTCEIAGYGDRAVLEPDLMEWDYGRYEGRTAAQIREEHPGWIVFNDGASGGESVAQAIERADRIVAKLRAAQENVLVFSHGHFLRLLTVRWLGMPTILGARMMLGTAAVCQLGYNHGLDEPSLHLWNDDRHITESVITHP